MQVSSDAKGVFDIGIVENEETFVQGLLGCLDAGPGVCMPNGECDCSPSAGEPCNEDADCPWGGMTVEALTKADYLPRGALPGA